MNQTLNGLASTLPSAEDVPQGDKHPLLNTIVDLERYSLDEITFRKRCKYDLEEQGALVLRGFLTAAAIVRIANEGAMRYIA